MNNNLTQENNQTIQNNNTPQVNNIPTTQPVNDTQSIPQVVNNIQTTPAVQPTAPVNKPVTTTIAPTQINTGTPTTTIPQNNIQVTPQPAIANPQATSVTPQNAQTIQTPETVQTQNTQVQASTPPIQTDNNQPTDANNQNQNNEQTSEKDKSIMRFVPLLFFIVVIVLGVYVGRDKITSLVSKDKTSETENTTTNDNKDQTNNNQNNENNNQQTTESETNNTEQTTQPETDNTNTNCSTTPTWNGVYTNETSSIKLYQKNQSEIIYTGTINNYALMGIADEITGNKASGEIFDTYTFEICNDILNFTTTDQDLSAVTLTKTSEYTKNDYYADTYGDPSYLNTELNGIFKKGNTTLKLFQKNSTDATLIIIEDGSYFGRDVSVVGNTIDYEDDSFDNIEKINITISGNTLTLVASDTDTDGILNSVSGTYTKESSYTIDQIIEEN